MRSVVRLPFLLVLCTGCMALREPRERFTYERLCMGVRTVVMLHAPDADTAREAANAAFARIAAVEQAASDYRPESEAMRLCRAGTAVVGADLWALLVASREVWRASDGAFDPTLGPVVALWREMRTTGTRPAEDLLAQARAKCGFDKVTLDAATQRVTLATPGMRLDFGGIAKGYAAQVAVEELRARGLAHCLVALAGDVVAGAAPPGTPGWRVELAEREGGMPFQVLWIADQALSTSGAAHQSVTRDGVTYAHVVDPRTGLGARRLHTCSVLAPRGEQADGWSTALALLGPEAARRLVPTLPHVAAIVYWQALAGNAIEIVDPEKLLRAAPAPVESRPQSRP